MKPLFGKCNDAVAVFGLELLQGQCWLSRGQFGGSPAPIEFVEHFVHVLKAVVDSVGPQFNVDKAIHGGTGEFNQPVLHALKPT